DVLDFIGSAAQGDILYRGSSGWARLAAGTSGQFLKTLGAGANPAWASATSTPWDFAPPAAADFTLFTCDATAATKSDDADIGLKVTTSAAANTGVLRGGYKALPAVGTDFTLTVKWALDADNVSLQGGGITMYENATGKSITMLGFGDPSAFQLRKQTIAGGGPISSINYASYHLHANEIW